MKMKQVIAGMVYNTETAQRICALACDEYPGDFQYHNTKLYRTKNGNYFIAGSGGAMSLWGKWEYNSYCFGSGIRAIKAEEARNYAEAADCSPDEMMAAGFVLTEA